MGPAFIMWAEDEWTADIDNLPLIEDEELELRCNVNHDHEECLISVKFMCQIFKFQLFGRRSVYISSGTSGEVQ